MENILILDQLFQLNNYMIKMVFCCWWNIRKIDAAYVAGYEQYGKKLDGVYKKDDGSGPVKDIFDKNGNKLADKYNKVKSDLPDEIYDKLTKLDGTYKMIVSDPVSKEVFVIYGNKLDGVYRKLESDLPRNWCYNKNGNKLGDKNKCNTKYTKWTSVWYKREKMASRWCFYRLGNKIDGTFKEIYDITGEKLDRVDKKAELVPQEDIYDKRGNKLDGWFIQKKNWW